MKNVDLWQALDARVARHDIEWHWVKGHAGDPGTSAPTRSPTAASNRAGAVGGIAFDRRLRKFTTGLGGTTLALRASGAPVRDHEREIAMGTLFRFAVLIGCATLAGCMTAYYGDSRASNPKECKGPNTCEVQVGISCDRLRCKFELPDPIDVYLDTYPDRKL